MTREESQELIDLLKTGSSAQRNQFFNRYLEADRKFDVDSQGNTILHYAARYGNIEDYHTLMDMNMDDLIEVQNYEGMTPDLYNIAYGKDILIAKEAAEYGVEDFEDAFGNSPLHLAAAYNPDKEFTKLVLDFEYWIHHTNKMMETPLDLALKHQTNPEVIQLLLNAETKQLAISGSENNSAAVRDYLNSLGHKLSDPEERVFSDAMLGDLLHFYYTKCPSDPSEGFVEASSCKILSMEYRRGEFRKFLTPLGELFIYPKIDETKCGVLVDNDKNSHFVVDLELEN